MSCGEGKHQVAGSCAFGDSPKSQLQPREACGLSTPLPSGDARNVADTERCRLSCRLPREAQWFGLKASCALDVADFVQSFTERSHLSAENREHICPLAA